MKFIVNIEDEELARCLIKKQLSDRQSRDILNLVRESFVSYLGGCQRHIQNKQIEDIEYQGDNV